MIERLGDHCGRLLAEIAEKDLRIRVLDGDLADSDGAHHFASRYPSRFIMAGIAEQNMVSMAAGMASCGLRPFVFSFAAFLCYRAFDQIRICISQAKQPVTLVGSHCGGCTSRNGKSHAALNDIALMASLPNIHLWSPADAKDVQLAVIQSLQGTDPVYIRTPRTPLSELEGSAERIRIIGEPVGIAIVSTGMCTHLSLAAAALLRGRGKRAFVVHLAQVVPLPAHELSVAIANASAIYAVEDHSEFGGLAGCIRHFLPQCQVHGIGWPMDWSGESGADEEILQAHSMDAAGLVETITRTTFGIGKSKP